MTSIMEAIFGSNTAANVNWITCCEEGCGAMFAVPAALEARFRKSHENFCCPFGHGLHFSAKNSEEKLREQLAQQMSANEQLETSRRRAWDEAKLQKRKAAAARGVVTRVKHRVGNGVCPCCNRYFESLHRHMATQHPDFRKPGEVQA